MSHELENDLEGLEPGEDVETGEISGETGELLHVDREPEEEVGPPEGVSSAGEIARIDEAAASDDLDEEEENEEDEVEDGKTEGSSLDDDERYGSQQHVAWAKADEDVNVAHTINKKRGHTYKAARDINIGATEKLEFGPIPSALQEKLGAVFVEPTGYRDVLDARRAIEAKRVVLVHGTEHSGRWSCAVQLADDLREAAAGELPEESRINLQQYMRPRNSELSLISVVSAEDFPAKSIVLLRDCFERSIRHEELEAAQLADLSDALRSKGSFLILTGEASHLAALGVVILTAEGYDLYQVLANHLTHLNSGDASLGKEQLDAIRPDGLWLRLRRYLTTPFHVDQFSVKLAGKPLEDNVRLRERIVERLAKEVATGGSQAMRRWFSELHPNDQLFGMLVVLFVGAERRWLEALHRRLVSRFRADQLHWFSDPREQGLEETRERLHLVELGGRLEPEDKTYERELLWQIENRQHLLWEALLPLAALEEDELMGSWSEPWKRQALGVALGRAGRHDPVRLTSVLDSMAADGNHRRAVVPGYALQELVRDGSTDLVGRVLRSWIRSKNHRKMWAAGAALWRVHLASQSLEDQELRRQLQENVFTSLRLLGIKQARMKGTNRRSIFYCVVDALRQIVLTDPDQATIELTTWLVGTDTDISSLGRRSVRAVYEHLSQYQQKPSLGQQKSLVRLLSPLLEKAGPNSVDVQVLLLTVRGWLRWPELRPEVFRVLTEISTFASARRRERLRSRLERLWLAPCPAGAERVARKVVRSNKRGNQWGPREQKQVEALISFWCEGTEAVAQEIAQAVVARCYAVDGVLPSLPGLGPGLVVVDPAPLTSSQGPSNNAVWHLVALLDSRLDLTLLRLGEAEPILLQDKLADCELVPRFSNHRLLMPALEALPLEQKGSVFLVAPRKPHDFEDLLAQSWLHELIYIGPRDKSEAITDQPYIHLELSWPPSTKNLEDVCSALEAHWARALASGPADRWLELVHAFGLEEEGREPRRRLSECAESLRKPPATEGAHDDPMWKAVVLSLWWAASDLPECLHWICSWLSPPEDDSAGEGKRVIASAAASALIRLYTAYPPEPRGDGRAPTALFGLLAEPLGSRGADGVEALVRLVTHWLSDRAWAEYLTADVQKGRGRLQRWVDKHLEDRPELASLLEAQVSASQSNSTEQSWAALAGVVARFKALQALERPDQLPEIAPVERYVLLVIDADRGHEKAQEHLARVTAGLHSEFLARSEGGIRLIPVIYRLGDCSPFWATKPGQPDAARLRPRSLRRPRLLGPLLQASEAIREQVETVLLLTSREPLDLEDWVESPWWEKVRLYGSASAPRVPSFRTLPKPLGRTLSTEVGHLVGHLASPPSAPAGEV